MEPASGNHSVIKKKSIKKKGGESQKTPVTTICIHIRDEKARGPAALRQDVYRGAREADRAEVRREGGGEQREAGVHNKNSLRTQSKTGSLCRVQRLRPKAGGRKEKGVGGDQERLVRRRRGGARSHRGAGLPSPKIHANLHSGPKQLREGTKGEENNRIKEDSSRDPIIECGETKRNCRTARSRSQSEVSKHDAKGRGGECRPPPAKQDL